MSRQFLRITLFALLLAATTGALAQQASFVPNVGLSKDMRSVTSNRWTAGFNLGLNAFWQVSPWISVGGRVAYHSWGADGDGWATDYAKDNGVGYTYTVANSSGDQSVVEIVPSLKIATTSEEAPTRLEIQLGAGLFLVSASDVTVGGSFRSSYSSGTISVKFPNQSLTGIGFQAGLPLTIANSVQILPLYSLYWAGGDAYHHITLSAGIVL